MDRRAERLIALIKDEGLEKLKNSKCIIFGLGGVGSFAIEALARSFVGNLYIVDFDTIDITNINRQIHANSYSISKYKVDEIEKRIMGINPNCKITKISKKLTENNVNEFFETDYDYVLDAIDDYDAKVSLIKYCLRNKIKIISSMGLGNRLDPTKIEITKLERTQACGLARKLRRNIKNTRLTVVASKEHPKKNNLGFAGTVPFVPSVGGLMMASHVVRYLIEK